MQKYTISAICWVLDDNCALKEPLSFLFCTATGADDKVVGVVDAEKAGTERLNVRRRPPVPNPDSGPTVCIVFSVNVLLLLLLPAAVVDVAFACFTVLVIELIGAVSDGPDWRIMLGCCAGNWVTGRTVIEGIRTDDVCWVEGVDRVISIPKCRLGIDTIGGVEVFWENFCCTLWLACRGLDGKDFRALATGAGALAFWSATGSTSITIGCSIASFSFDLTLVMPVDPPLRFGTTVIDTFSPSAFRAWNKKPFLK